MKVLLQTESPLMAMSLRDYIIKSVKGQIEDVKIETWSYIKSSDNFDVIYHDPQQYVDDPEKNVLFRVEIDGSIVSLSAAWWKKNPEPSIEMMCLHTGRLTEMLLRYFRNSYIKYSIVD